MLRMHACVSVFEREPAVFWAKMTLSICPPIFLEGESFV